MSEVLLTPQEIRKLKRMCKDPMLELGMMMRPEHMQCFEEKVVTRFTVHIINFKENDDAKKWNDMHREAILMKGHVTTVAVATLVFGLTKNPVVGSLGGIGASIIKDEIQADEWFPEMFKGWSLTRHYSFRYVQFPNPYLRMKWTDTIRDENGKVKELHVHNPKNIRVGGPYGIPEEVIRNIITQPTKILTTNFK